MVENQPHLFVHVGSYEGSLLGFEGETLQSQYAFGASLGSIKCLLSVGRYLLVGGYEELIKIYDIRKRREDGILEGHGGTISVLRTFDNFIFSGSEDSTIKVWKTKDWALIETLQYFKPVVDLAIHQSGKLMISLTKDGKIQIWNLLNLQRMFQRKYVLDGLFKVSFYGEQSLLLLGNKSLAIVDTETNKICQSVQFTSGLTDMATYKEFIIVADQSGVVHFIEMDLNEHKIIMKFKAHDMRVKQLSIVEGDLTVLVTICSNGEIKVWDCLNYLTDEVTETIDLGDKIQPINVVKTNSRLTSHCAHYFKRVTEQVVVEETVQKVPEKKAPTKKQIYKKELKKKKQKQLRKQRRQQQQEQQEQPQSNKKAVSKVPIKKQIKKKVQQ